MRCAGGVGEEEPKLDHALSTLGLSFLANHWGVALVVSELTSKVGIMHPIFTHLQPRAAGGFDIPLIPVSCSPSANQDPARGKFSSGACHSLQVSTLWDPSEVREGPVVVPFASMKGDGDTLKENWKGRG